eukprot:TRINITY_DN122266_c0_g1_i1.p1 TRINITY_DN122266_c0_g1~~TRINITY_DN122266_c0_g1_i1.p1  ORF type:complete len:165 (-),score=17.57 TRINITY_DN122266_c0_g1_i1:470-964(-)
MLNGVCNGDLEGRYTYISKSGNSVVDYFLLSDELFALVHKHCQLSVAVRIDSDHLPLELCIGHDGQVSKTSVTTEKMFIEKTDWNHDSGYQFINLMNSDKTRERLKCALGLLDVDINEALKIVNDLLKENAQYMKRRICINKQKAYDEWYDAECTFNKYMFGDY